MQLRPSNLICAGVVQTNLPVLDGLDASNREFKMVSVDRSQLVDGHSCERPGRRGTTPSSLTPLLAEVTSGVHPPGS